MKKELDKLREHTKQFAMVVDCFAASVPAPLWYDSDIQHLGFRYGKPNAKHFCMLKAVRAVSGLNAAIALAEKGFHQEACVLIRTIVDCTAQIEFVLAGLNGDVLAKKQQKVVDNFFDDFRRNGASDYKGSAIRQEDVHAEISRYLEGAGVTGSEGRFKGVSAKNLMSNVYRNFSNYIHARYPEVMDMFGGRPGHFHMNGMSGTPKDNESLALVTSFTNSVSITLSMMIQKFDMIDTIKNIPELAHWVKDEESKAAQAGD